MSGVSEVVKVIDVDEYAERIRLHADRVQKDKDDLKDMTRTIVSQWDIQNHIKTIMGALEGHPVAKYIQPDYFSPGISDDIAAEITRMFREKGWYVKNTVYKFTDPDEEWNSLTIANGDVQLWENNAACIGAGCEYFIVHEDGRLGTMSSGICRVA